MNILKENEMLIADGKRNVKVNKFLAGGGQGEVYRVTVDTETYALKWYYDNIATAQQKNNIESLIAKGSPSDNFLWPLSMVSSEINNKSFGYLMKLRLQRFKGITDLMKGRINPTFNNLITACYNLSNSFTQLHAKGLCYKDISHGNIFIDENNGGILICDNDNVAVNNDKNASVLGTPRFMAPEVVRSESLPNTSTDLFSLSVLIFYIMFLGHPLEGKKEAEIKCFDLPAMNKLYGTDPIFIFDPNNDSNRPVKGYQDNPIMFWDIYSTKNGLRNLAAVNQLKFFCE